MQVDSPAKPELSPTAEEMPSDVTPPPVHEKGSTEPTAEHTFQLYDLRVEVVCPPGKRILCGAKPGDYFTLEGELLKLPPGQGFSIYSLGAVLPLLAAKQRVASPHDWMTTDAEVACPDPHCPSRLRIVRTGLRTFRRADTTVVPLPSGSSSRSSSSTSSATAAPSPATPRAIPASTPSPMPEVSPGAMASDEPPDTPTTPQPAAPSPLFTEADPGEEHSVEFCVSGRNIGPLSFDYLRADWG